MTQPRVALVPANATAFRLRSTIAAIRHFRRDEDGSLIVFSLFIFVAMMMFAGLSLDLMRYENTRVTMQSTLDRAVLAAASMSNNLDPKDVVEDYFAKAKLSSTLKDVKVRDLGESRLVEVDASFKMDTHFFELAGMDYLSVPASGAASESIGNLEIALVLDVSGSMNRENRLPDLKVAAKNFLDDVFAQTTSDSTAISIVPYATQVAAGEKLIEYFERGSTAHSFSYCLNFEADEFGSTQMPLDEEREQTVHFDPWYSTKSLRLPVCPEESARSITAWSNDAIELKDQVDALFAAGNTSIDIGLKWGAALLDPGLQDGLASMATDGEVDASLIGRPASFNDSATSKVIVVMTDGVNTEQYHMDDPYREGPSNVWGFRASMNNSPNGQNFGDPNSELFVSLWRGSGDPDPGCANGGAGCPSDWYIPHKEEWSDKPWGEDQAYQLDWRELWAEFPVKYHLNEHLGEISGTSAERNAIRDAVDYVARGEKDARMRTICTAAKNQGIIVFSIGLSITEESAAKMRACASTPSHYFDVNNDEIDYAFRAIANEVAELRLVN